MRFSSSRFLAVCVAVTAVAVTPGLVSAADQDQPAGGVPAPVEQIPLVYPYDLAVAGVEGEAVVQFNIDARGFTGDVVVVNASHPAFGLAVKAMIEAEHFAPQVQDDKPVARTGLKQEVRFTTAGLDPDTRAMLDELKKPQPGLTKARELDAVPPKLTMAATPAYPQSLRAAEGQAAKGGEAVVACIIDRHGRVLLPRIVSATTEDCGWAAATALLRWQFEPPTKGGQPVATRMQIPIEFAPPKN